MHPLPLLLALLATVHARIHGPSLIPRRAAGQIVPPELEILSHGFPLHRRAAPGVPGNETGLIQYLDNGKADIYIIHLSIGEPPISYPFQLDTASADLIIASSLCTTTSCPDVKSSKETPVYVPGRSGSFQPINGNSTTFNMSYADGARASGFIALETVTIGGPGGVVVPDQAVGVVNQTTLDLQALGVSGVVGLGFPRLSLLVRAGLGESATTTVTTTRSAASSTSTSATDTSTSATDTSTSSIDPTSLFFSILPIETITPIAVPTTSTTTLRRRAPASGPAYYPPILESLFSHPSVNTSSPRLTYPVFGLALANTSEAYSKGNANGSVTWGGVSSAYVDGGKGRSVADIDWVQVVPFARAIGSPSGGAVDLTTLEGDEYLYWTVPLRNVSVNGTDLALRPTYNASFTGSAASIALLDVGTNGIYAPQQDVVALFDQIKDARQVSDGQWAVPCDTEVTLSFTLGTNGRTVVTLQPSEWMYARVAGGGMCLAWPRVARPSADGVDWQLGTPVLRKVYTVFSYGISGVQAPLVGFLPLPPPTPTINTTTANASAPTRVQDAEEIMAHITATVATALPNVVLPDPTYPTPAYGFTTPAPQIGTVQSVGLANPLVYAVEEVSVVQVSSGTASGSGTQTGTGTQGQGGARTSAPAADNSTTSGAVSSTGGRAAGVLMAVVGVVWTLML